MRSHPGLSILDVLLSPSQPQQYNVEAFDKQCSWMGFTWWPVVKTLPSNARDPGSIPALGTKTLRVAGCGQTLINNFAVDVSLMVQKTFEV